MKIVYGGQKIVLSVGVVEVDGAPMPFVGMVDTTAHINGTFRDLDALQCVEMMDKSGGVVIFFENPDAASRMSFYLAALFDKASETEWGNVDQIEAVLQ